MIVPENPYLPVLSDRDRQKGRRILRACRRLFKASPPAAKGAAVHVLAAIRRPLLEHPILRAAPGHLVEETISSLLVMCVGCLEHGIEEKEGESWMEELMKMLNAEDARINAESN